MATKKMTEKMDKASDKRAGIKEDSRKDVAKDKRMGVTQPSKGRGGVKSAGPQD